MKLRTLAFVSMLSVCPLIPSTVRADPYEDEYDDSEGESDFDQIMTNLDNAGWTSVGSLNDGVVMSKDLGSEIEYILVTPGSPSEIEYLGTFPKV